MRLDTGHRRERGFSLIELLVALLILAFVVIVIGGIGSIKGALVGALLVGLTDTLGKFLLPIAFRTVMEPIFRHCMKAYTTPTTRNSTPNRISLLSQEEPRLVTAL